MDASQTWIVASLVVLAAVALLVFRAGRAGNKNRLTPLAGLAFGFVIAGLVFGDERWLRYGLFAVGVILAVVDLVKRSRGT
jgi:biotin transporter BioY